MSLVENILEILGWKKEKSPYWLKIGTEVPQCIYYFGPFDRASEAKASQAGYIEDLTAENAIGISVKLLRRSQPEELTICQEDIF